MCRSHNAPTPEIYYVVDVRYILTMLESGVVVC